MSNNPFDEVNNNIAKIQEQVLCLTKLLNQYLVDKPNSNEIGGIDLAMQVTGLKKATIYCHISKNKIPHFKRGGRVYFSKQALQEWITQEQRGKNDIPIVEPPLFPRRQKHIH